MKFKIVLFTSLLLLSSCGKYGMGGYINHSIGDWAEVNLPSGCVVKQIATESSGKGVAILCNDGRVFD
jgi:hypothetical protein